MRIYTKVGDGGNTYLPGGRKVSKGDQVVGALGAVDELNAALGLARALLPRADPAGPALVEAQKLLLVLGSDIAAPSPRASVPRVRAADAARLEKAMDALEAGLPPLKNFILPGGSPAGAALHLARAVCRRAERDVVGLLKKKRASRDAQVFLNRLSDFLFLLARDASRRAGAAEERWVP